MIAWIKRLLELRCRRAESRRHLERHGLIIKPSGFSCYLCGEETVGLHPVLCETSPAGETFRWTGQPGAHACLRCQMVAPHGDCSGAPRHSPAEWKPSAYISIG